MAGEFEATCPYCSWTGGLYKDAADAAAAERMHVTLQHPKK
jgi:hypothetical protein